MRIQQATPMSTDVLVAVESARHVSAALDLGAAVAERKQGGVSLVGVLHDHPPWGYCFPLGVPWPMATLRDDGLQHLRQACVEVVRRLDANVPVQFWLSPGRPVQVVDSLLATREFAAVVLKLDCISRRAMRRVVNRWRAVGIEVHGAER